MKTHTPVLTLNARDLRTISDNELLSRTEHAAGEERRITTEVLKLLREVERRMLYAELGYSSLWEYAVKRLRYSESSAQRRISAMRAMKELPEIEAKIKSGELTVAAVSQAQSFFRAEVQVNGRELSLEEKKGIVAKLEGQSRRECERILLSCSVNPALVFPKERERVVTPTQSQITFIADEELQAMLRELKDLTGFRGSYAQLFKCMASEMLTKLKNRKRVRPVSSLSVIPSPQQPEASNAATVQSLPLAEVRSGPTAVSTQKLINTADATLQKAVNTSSDASISGSAGAIPAAISKKHSRYRARAVEAEVRMRDGNRCTYVDKSSGHRCTSTFALELDHHPIPFAQGGPSTVDNLVLKCPAHNRLGALKDFGHAKMQAYVPSLR